MPELGRCRCCEGKVSSEALACPHCGQPNPYDNGVSAITLLDPGPRHIEIIKLVREVTGFGLKQAKDLVDNTPSALPVHEIARMNQQQLQSLIAQLRTLGASVRVD